MPIHSIIEHEPEESVGACFNADFDSDVTAKAQSQQAWLIGNYEAVREQYHELAKLTTSLYAIQADLEHYLQTYGGFDVPNPLNSPGYSQPLPTQVLDSFAEGGSDNPLEIRDEDMQPEMDDRPVRNQDVLSGNCLGDLCPEGQASI